MKQIIILIVAFSVILTFSDSEIESRPVEGATNTFDIANSPSEMMEAFVSNFAVTNRGPAEEAEYFVDPVAPTVPVTEAESISESPLFSLLWSQQGPFLTPVDLPVTKRIACRIPTRNLFVSSEFNNKKGVKILDAETGRELVVAIIPEPILQNHCKIPGIPNLPYDFKYAVCRDQDDTFLLVQATQFEHEGYSARGIGTALYCCSLDGEILWTFLGLFTHDVCVIPVSNGSDVIVIGQGDKQIVLLSASGKELRRINTPIFNTLEIKNDHESGVVKFCFFADKANCYALINKINEVVGTKTNPRRK